MQLQNAVIVDGVRSAFARGGRGKPVVKRSDFAAVDWELPEVPDLGGAKE